MIRFQIIENAGADLHKALLSAMRSGALRTFVATKRGRRIQHLTHPGWMSWTSSRGVISCEVHSPRKPGQEWQFLGAFMGRLADRYSSSIAAINIQFPRPDHTE
jgi:hypothetical protein